MLEGYPDIMNFKQFRKALGLGKNKAYCLLRTDEIRHFTIGTNYKIPKICIINYIKEQMKEKVQS